MTSKDHGLVIVARAVRTRGLAGELVAEVLTDFPERFENVSQLQGVRGDGELKTFDLESYWFQNDRMVLKFAGVDSIEAAQGLVGYEFGVAEADRVPLSENEFYDWELAGCQVEIEGGTSVGSVREVLRTGGVDVIVVESEAGREHLIPLADSIVISIDTSAKMILIDPPEGLLDL
ncbi:MAG TPA: ribosome maturation factor RimM [Pyrinomonadaceae bacterium]|nr:ribosome maturation factor RimM [Pyrinomonadaceae bacterium]